MHGADPETDSVNDIDGHRVARLLIALGIGHHSQHPIDLILTKALQA